MTNYDTVSRGGEEIGKRMKGMEEKEVGGEGIKVASRIDAVGLFCPVPIVKLKQAMDKLKSKEIIEVLADDPGFPEDVIAWCKETHNRLISLDEGDESTFVARVEKS
jgi:TusA-related sulfurtransferase